MALNIKNKMNKLLGMVNDYSFHLKFKLLNVIPKSIVNARGLRILIFHGVCDTDQNLFNSRFISSQQFEAQIKLIKYYFNPISKSEFINKQFSNEKLNILVTFDDGLKNNMTIALPILRKHNVPAIFFVTGLSNETLPYMFNDLTDVFPLLAKSNFQFESQIFKRNKVGSYYRLVNNQNMSLATLYQKSNFEIRNKIMEQLIQTYSIDSIRNYSTFYDLMTNEDIKILSDSSLYSIGYHGYFHSDLSSQNSKDLKIEFEKMIVYFNSICSEPIDMLAFPYGHYNSEVLDMCKKNNIPFLFKTENRLSDIADTSVFERLTINPFVFPMTQLYYIAKNSYA
jgi:peptidoglycan/xylan/chitin deacetylase (PgdA/CDA1 family)